MAIRRASSNRRGYAGNHLGNGGTPFSGNWHPEMSDMSMYRVSVSILLLARAGLAAAEFKIDVRQAQLFLDDEIIEHSPLLQRVVHQPVRSPLNPIYRPEAPWEGGTMNYLGGVYRD